ncbi:MAG: hypothetical protein WC295_09770 [Methanoregula sp.]
MGNLYLDSGESIIQTTDRISVNAVASELLLTNRRLILVDSTHRGVDPLMIPFATIVSLQGGWNLIGEPVITLTLTDPEEGRTEVLDLVFYQQSGEHRKAECDAWAQYLMDHIVLARQDTIRTDVPPAAPKPGLHPSVRRWVAPDMIHPHTTVTPSRPIPSGDVMTPPTGAEGGIEEEARAQSLSTPPGEKQKTVVPDEIMAIPGADDSTIRDSAIPEAIFVPEPELPETPPLPPEDRVEASPTADIPPVVSSTVQESPVTFPIPFPVLHIDRQQPEPPVLSTDISEPVSLDIVNHQLTNIPTTSPVPETPASHEMFPIPFPVLHTEIQHPEFPVIPTNISEPVSPDTFTSPLIVTPVPETSTTAPEPEPVSREIITPPPIVRPITDTSIPVPEPESVSSVTLTSLLPNIPESPTVMETPAAVPESEPVSPVTITSPVTVTPITKTPTTVSESETISPEIVTYPAEDLPIQETPITVVKPEPVSPETITPPPTVTPITETSISVPEPEPVSSVTLTSPLPNIPENPPVPETPTAVPESEPVSPVTITSPGMASPIPETPTTVPEPALPVPIHQAEPPVVAAPCVPAHKTAPPTPEKPPVPTKPPILAIVLLILIIAGGAGLYVFISGWNNGAHNTDITPAPTQSPTPSQPVIVIPENGIWVHVNSNSTFVGSYGNPGSLQLVSGSGNEFYRIQNPDSLVQATFQKQEYSGDPLTINIYRNGTLITHRTITAPRGTIDIIIDAKTGNPPALSKTIPV